MRYAAVRGGLALVSLCAAAGCRGPASPKGIDPPAAPGAMAPNVVAADDEMLATWLEPVGAGGKAFRLRFARLTRTFPFSLPWFRTCAWSAPSTIVERADLLANWADFPSVACAADGTLFAHWMETTGDETYDACVGRSTDGGSTWKRVGRLHEATPGEHGFVSLIAEGSREVRAIWLDGRDAARPGGASSLRTALVGDSVRDERVIDARVCDCCQTAMASTVDGPIVAYRDRDGEVRDIAIVRRTEKGWTQPTPLHGDGWLVPGCPVNGPALAARERLVVAAWYTYAGGKPRVLAAFSGDAGATFGAPIEVDASHGRSAPTGRVDLVLDGDGALVIWVSADREDAAVFVRRVSADGRRGKPFPLFVTRAERDAGFPRMERIGDELALAVTKPGNPSSLHANLTPISWVPPLSTAADPEPLEIEVAREATQAPEFAARSLKGEPRLLASLRGQVVLLNVWATWCEPCRHEIPEINLLYERHAGDGLHVVGVSVDRRETAVVEKFAARHKIRYEVWHDPDDSASQAFGIRALPATLLYDRSGRLVWHGHVPHGGSRDLDRQIGLALAGGHPAHGHPAR